MMNEYPTSCGVNLKRWELYNLGRFIHHVEEDIERGCESGKGEYEEIKMTLTQNGIIIRKKKHWIMLKKDDYLLIKQFIPGAVYLMGLLRPLEMIKDETAGQLLEDVYIFSLLLKTPEFDSKWVEEEMIIKQKLTDEAKNLLDKNTEVSWDVYNCCILIKTSIIGSSSEKDFKNKLQGGFLKGLIDSTLR